MKRSIYSIFVFSACTIFCTICYRDSNRGNYFVANQFTLNTKNFQTKPGLGWNGGLSIRGNFYIIYGIQFSENNFTVATKSNFLVNEDVNLKLASAQISLQLSYRLIKHILSIEFGPIVQVVVNLSMIKQHYFRNPLLVKDIQDISKFNFYPAVG
jgi:hypothetical protein